MEKVERTNDISKSVVQLTRSCARHKALSTRWERRNTFHDDRMKEALLLNLPQNRIAACLGISNFNTISFAHFTRHCQMILAAAKTEKTSEGNEKTTKAELEGPVAAVAAVDVTTTDSRVLTTPSRQITPSQRCPNCGVHGHFLRSCPHPRVKCEVCGRSGHRKEICYKAQQEAPNGKVRTTYLRMTRSGIHIDLMDEATKRSLFEAMRRHLESQEEQAARARDKTAVKREEKRRATRGEIPAEEESLPSQLGMESEMLAEAVAYKGVPDVARVSEDIDGKQYSMTVTKYVDVTIFSQITPGLLDSGAVVSLLYEAIWTRIPSECRELLSIAEAGVRPISGLGGELKVKIVVDIPITVARRGLLQRFFVSPNVGTIILGADALRGLGITLNFDTGTIHFDNGKKIVPESETIGVSPLCVSLVSASSTKLTMNKGVGCTDAETKLAKMIFLRYPEVWKHPEVGECRLTTHHIQTGDSQPVSTRARRLPPEKLKELQRQLQELQESGAIQRSESPWASPVVLVLKANGKIRLCVDYRRLNAVTQRGMYLLPRITELFDRLRTTTIFSTLDLTAGFHQIHLHDDSRKKTAFITPEGLYEFRVVPFGLTNAPSTFQRTMDCLFRNTDVVDNVSVYLDDIVIFTDTAKRHAEVLEQVCKSLKEAVMPCKPVGTQRGALYRASRINLELA